MLIFLVARFLHASQFALGLLTLGICLLAFIGLLFLYNQAGKAPDPSDFPLRWGSQNPSGSLLLVKDWSISIMLVCLGIGMCIILFSCVDTSLKYSRKQIMSLILLSFAGLYGLLLAEDLFSIYLFSELICVSASGMIMSKGKKSEVVKATLKYLIMGSTATLIMLMGISLVYRESGHILISAFSGLSGFWARLGAGFFLVGLSLKIGIVPLHGWLPDAYEQAPDVVTSLLAGFISGSALFILPGTCLAMGLQSRELGLYLILGSFINMFVGNITALTQKNNKRKLAYSSIAYTGYMMFAMGLGVYFDLPSALAVSLFLFFGHACMKSLAFLSLGQIETSRQNLSKSNQVFSRITFSIAIAGLAAIPPLAGFTGKWSILLSALEANTPLAWFGLSVLLINSLLSLGYYLPLLRIVFSTSSKPVIHPNGKRSTQFLIVLPLAILALLVVWMGIQPTFWINLANLFKVN